LKDIAVDGKTVIPRDSLIGGTITQVKTAQQSKRAEIEFRLDTFKFDDGTEIPLKAETVKMKGDDAGGGTKAVLNGVISQGIGQAAQGAVLGGLFGGRKAAGIGAALGVGATVLSQTVLQPRVPGPELDLSRGVAFEVRLKSDVSIPSRLAGLRPAPSVTDTRSDIRPDNGPLASLSNPNDALFPKTENPVLNTPPDRRRENGNVPIVSNEPLPVPVFVDPPAQVTTSAAVTGTSPLDAPPDAPPVFKLSVDVNLAQVDALVRDRGGRPISNLTITDFRLFEDGVERPIQTFSRDQLPLALALVIDRSNSVAPSMREIQRSAFQALAQLKEGDEACLFTFDENVFKLESLTSDRQRVANRIGTIDAGGGTNIVNAVYAAVRYLEDNAQDRRRAVLLISDNANGLGDMAVTEAIRLAQQSETVVYSVKIDPIRGGLPSVFAPIPPPFSVGNNPVPDLTRETGGEVFDVARVGSIERAMATVVERLKTRYTLGYSPTGEDPRAYRRIEVRLVDRFGKPDSDYTVLSRSGNYSNPTRSRR
jgi:VWFA-related protein